MLKRFVSRRARDVRAGLVVCALATCPMVVLNARVQKAASGAFAASNWNHASLGAIDRHVFDLALGAASCAVQSGAVPDPSTLTVIDYSKSSAEKRLWVFDLRSHALLYEELVAHGKGSGDSLRRPSQTIRRAINRASAYLKQRIRTAERTVTHCD